MSFQSRYRAASHFRKIQPSEVHRCLFQVSISLSSGFSFQENCGAFVRSSRYHVSISLSSGFSFQVRCDASGCLAHAGCFNLVIERLLISGALHQSCPHTVISFNLVIERLLISGIRDTSLCDMRPMVSISLSSGFSFQVKSARHRPIVAEWFQSRYRAASHFRCL